MGDERAPGREPPARILTPVRTAIAVASVFSSLALFAACRPNRRVAEATPDAAAGRDASSASAEPPRGEPSLAPSQAPFRWPDEAAKAALDRWTEALNAHDVRRLADLYGDPVRYYGRLLSKAELVRAKAKALAGRDYHQEVRDAVTSGFGGIITVYFTKYWGDPRPGSLRARLGLEGPDGGPLLIVEESDESVDRAQETREPELPSDECETVVEAVVQALPAVTERVRAALDDEAKPGGIKFGGLGSYPEPDDAGGFIASLGYGAARRREDDVIVWTVKRDGTIRVTVDGAEVAVPARARREVTRACKR